MSKKEIKSDDNQKPKSHDKDQPESGMWQLFADFFDLEKTFLVFSIIYFPLAILFFTQGTLERVLLMIYTVMLAGLGLLLVSKFAIFIAHSANEHKDNYGGVLIMYIWQVAFPLVMFKVFGAVLMAILPIQRLQSLSEISECSLRYADKMQRYYGVTFDIQRLIEDIYYNVLQYQRVLDLLLVSTFVVVGLLVMWSIGRKTK